MPDKGVQDRKTLDRSNEAILLGFLENPMLEATQHAGSEIRRIFDVCYSAIGGNSNSDILNYFNSRKQKITRDAFFQKVVGAVWVSGMSRKSASTFLEKSGFNYDFTTFASMDRSELDNFIRRVHYLGVTPWAEKKWLAIYNIAQWLTKFTTGDEFRWVVFDGKTDGKELDKTDVQ